MNNSKEKGITLMALVMTIIVLSILASVGVSSGMQTLEYSKYTEFTSELKEMQTKVNELNQNGNFNMGTSLPTEMSEKLNNILGIEEISNIVYSNATTDEEKTKIKEGFRYFSNDYINNDLQLEGIKRSYLINIEYRYVIYPEGVEYKNKTYYMINQIDGEIYNVGYKNKNADSGSFDVNYIKENDRRKIEVTNISYNGYISNWQVRYRPKDKDVWTNVNGTEFYVSSEGDYYVQVYHDEINLGSKLVEVIDETNTSEADTAETNTIETDNSIDTNNLIDTNNITE